MRLIDHTGHLVETGNDFVIRQILKARREKGSGEAAGAQIPGKGEMTRVPHLFRISGHGERSR